jgi:hypothetical protein
MGLEILNNRTEHTHENEQFRRVVNIIENVFDKLGYDGLLIGNPFNETYSRFRADAILFYNNGLILVDFKDYQGIVKLPPNEAEFHSTKWYNEGLKDRNRLEIKAGSKFINPFKQLGYYRNAFREIVENNIYLNGTINSSRVCIANIFSGPVEIVNEVPRNMPYYKIVQESDLGKFLYDFSGGDNAFSTEIADVIKNIFPADKYIKSFEFKAKETEIADKIIKIEKDVESEIISFLSENEAGILVLESMNVCDRDSWVRFIQNEATNHNIPQVETWSYSSRISKRILRRANIETDGIYSVIYGGNHNLEVQNNENEDNNSEEELLEVIPLKSSEFIDEKAVIIVHEAHLVNRSLNQSELLRFGTGRLLEDIIKFLNPDSNRKIIFVGDPYSLTYGKNEDSALNLETLSELCQNKKINHYKQKIDYDYTNSKENLRINLASSIENKLFNDLNYDFDNETLKEVQRKEVEEKLKLWFGKPFDSEPNNGVLFFKNANCLTTNNWIKKYSLNNGEKLAKGDLLIANNNVFIPDDSGFQTPKKIINGMFFTVLGVKDSLTEHIKIKQTQNPINLIFTKLTVKCLSLNNTPETDLWILDNYFYSIDDLSREEKIAFRVFINQKINFQKNKTKFEDSKEYRQLLEDARYRELSEDEKMAIKQLAQNYNLPKDKKEEVKTSGNARAILALYNKLYTKHIFSHLRETDPFINALFAKYGWAITVHKALGSIYKEIIIKGYRKENDGITNDDYFRWLYSGISSSEFVCINSPQKINPLMNCTFEDNSINGTVTKEKSVLIFDNYFVEPRFADKLQAIENKNVIGAICEISRKLEQNGYLLESTKKFSEYLTKTYYSIPQIAGKQLILNIDNKGAKDNFAVGNIRIEKLETANEEFVKQSISECFSEIQSNNSFINGMVNFPTDFRNDIYRIWLNKCAELNIDLKITQSHNNQDVFRAIAESEVIIFRVWYGTSEQSHTRGFLSKIEILGKTSELFINKIKAVCIGTME